MTLHYEYTIKEISNGWLVIAENNYRTDNLHQYFVDKTEALKYVIKLLKELINE